MTLRLLVRIQLLIIILKFMQKIKIFLDVPYFWRTGFQDPASISMEGILIFNKHLTFLLSLALLFVVWLLVNAIHFFVGLGNRKKSQFVGSKKPEIAWLLVFLLTIPLVLFCDLAEISVTGLESTAESVPTKPGLLYFEISPEMYGSKTIDRNQVHEICLIILEFRKRGYTDLRIRNSFWTVSRSFWALDYSGKIESFQAHMDLEDQIKNNISSFVFYSALFIFVYTITPWIVGGG